MGVSGKKTLDAHDYDIDGAQVGNSGEFHFDAAAGTYLELVDDTIRAALRSASIFGYLGIRFTPRASALIAM